MAQHPGTLSGVLLKFKFPHGCMYADKQGLIRDGRSMLSVMTDCGMILSGWLAGNVGSHPCNIAIK